MSNFGWVRAGGATLLVAFALLLVSGCAQQPAGPPLPEPGLTGNEDGRATAVGVLNYVDLEGGFWRIAQTESPAQAADAPSVVVIINPGEMEEGLDSFEGRYVRAIGSLYDGASVRMAGQEMIVETIEALDAIE